MKKLQFEMELKLQTVKLILTAELEQVTTYYTFKRNEQFLYVFRVD